MKPRFTVLVALSLLLVSLGPNLVLAEVLDQPDPGDPDTCWVGTAVVSPGGEAVIPLTVFNDEQIAVFELTLRYDTPNGPVFLDSVSYVGSRAEHFRELFGKQYPEDKVVVLAGLSDPYGEGIPHLLPGNGLLANLYFSIGDSAAPQTITIDSTHICIVPNQNPCIGWHEFRFYIPWDSEEFLPQFEIAPSFSCGLLSIRGIVCENMDVDESSTVDFVDLLFLIDYVFRGGPAPVYPGGDIVLDGIVDFTDILYLIDFIFRDAQGPCGH